MCMHSHADHDHNAKNDRNLGDPNHTEHQSFWKSKAAAVMIGFAAVAGFFLITEHWAHLYGILPFLIILACPLMHIFMHHGHGNHGDHGRHDDQQQHSGHTHDGGRDENAPPAQKGAQS